MSSEPGAAIRLAGLGKRYEIYDRPHHRLLQTLLRGKRSFHRDFWALSDVSFEVRRGETVGIVGRNGSGKSTLLELVAGTLAPTTGSVRTHGRVAALLELGSGFDPEFTGRQNVYLNGSILGIPRREMDERIGAIEQFAGIGAFIGQPVKTYSSGMTVRLAFAVAAHATPDVLLVDEALAVGDTAFQQKCLSRVREMQRAGVAILLVNPLAFIEQREGRWRASEAAFTRAFDLDGPATAEWLAVHFLHLRQYADARRVLAVALASNRAAAVVPDAWARFSERGDVAAARAVLEVALHTRTPPDARVLGLLAQLEWFDGRADRALELIGTMDAAGAWLSPSFRFPAAVVAGDVLDSLGRHADARARYIEALTMLERRRSAAPDDAKVIAALGLTYAGLGRASARSAACRCG